MTLKISLLAVLAFAALDKGCPPTPVPPPPDASDAAPPSPSDGGSNTDYNLACAALALAGCPEGQNAACPVDMQRAQEGRITDYRPKCLAACHDKACVRACGKAVACQ